MLKMTIDNEEVLSDNDISIKEEILSPSSTILNNVYPKSWELDKDYTSRFYYPKDYSKLNIQNFNIEPEEAGKTIQINGSATLTDVDTSKESRVLRILGQTSQTGTPTPSSPIPINVVSGDNTIDICGKNFFDLTQTPDETNNVNFSVANGILTQTNLGTYARTGWFVGNLTPNVSYTLNINYSNPSGSSLQIRTYKEDKTTSLGQTSAVTNTSGFFQLTITPTEKKCYVRIYSNSTGTSNNNIVEFSNIQLEKGSTATTYEPYIGNSYPLYLGVENLLDIPNGSNVNQGVTVARNNNVITFSGTATGTYPSTGNFPFTIAPGTYTISSTNNNYDFYLWFRNSNSDLINSANLSKGTKTITITSSNITNLVIGVEHLTTGTSYNIETSIQIEKGSKKNSFSPYGANYIELGRIGNYVDFIFPAINGNSYYDSLTQEQKDELIYGSWYLHKEIGKVVLDGTENWNVVLNVDNSNLFRLNTTTNYVKDTLVYSNYYKGKTNQTGRTNFDIYLRNDNTVALDILDNRYTTKEDFKNWLSSHNTIVYYVLAIPTNTPITDTLLLSQLNDLES